MSETHRLLNLQADRIESLLGRHNIHARVTGGQLSPRWIQFHLQIGLGVKLSRVRGLADELALALGADTCRVARQRAHVTIEVPRADPQPVRLLPLHRRLAQRGPDGIPFGAALLGLADDGAPLLAHLPSPRVAHMLVAGTTGSGKSALAQTIIASLALNHRPSQLSFVLIDPKRRAFGPLTGLPHLLRPVIYEPQAITETLQRLVQLMLDRDQTGQLPTSGHGGEARVVVVIDELADLLMSTGPETHEALTRLVQRGREAGVHVIACTQKPAAAVVGSLAKANFPVRLAGKVTSPEDAKVATGYAGSGADRLQGPGDFIAVNAGRMIRFQAAYITPQEIIDALIPRIALERGSPSLHLPPAPDITAPENGDAKLAQYVERARATWQRLRGPDGALPRGGKAALAEAIFGDRSTAGHQGRWVARVIDALQGDTATLASTAHVSAHLGIARKDTTTTTPKTAFLRPRRSRERYRVVVVTIEDKK